MWFRVRKFWLQRSQHHRAHACGGAAVAEKLGGREIHSRTCPGPSAFRRSGSLPFAVRLSAGHAPATPDMRCRQQLNTCTNALQKKSGQTPGSSARLLVCSSASDLPGGMARTFGASKSSHLSDLFFARSSRAKPPGTTIAVLATFCQARADSALIIAEIALVMRKSLRYTVIGTGERV